MAGAQDQGERVHAERRDEWRSWLATHHLRDAGVWLVSWRRPTGRPALTYDESVEEALCFGWIDSKGRKLDEDRSMLWFAPRKPRSAWSRSNKDRVTRLEAAGLMTQAGSEVVARAHEDGSWNALDQVEALVIPPDLEAAFGRFPGSRENYAGFPKSAKRGILGWIVSAKRPETRAERVDETARLAAENVRANQGPRNR